MEVATYSPNGSPSNFDFNTARISPNYLSAPSSPKRFGEYYYLSAPTSPSRFFSQFDSTDDGFAFSVSGEWENNPSRSAEELFQGGKIKPLLNEDDDLSESAKSPLLSGPQQPKRSSAIAQGKKAIREALAPRKKKEEEISEERRGRDMTVGSSGRGSSRVTRSLSPYRISHYTWEEEANQSQSHTNNKDNSVSVKGSRKWSFRDFLLFRSASEGRGSAKDPLRKFPTFYRKFGESKTSIPGPSPNPNPGPRTRRKEPLSAHELHYARKKAESEDLKKKTFLPYKQGILGTLAGFRSR